MKLIKVLIFNMFLILTFSITLITAGTIKITSLKADIIQTVLYDDTYRFERVFVNDVWWIYVYNSDNVLIESYPEDID
ncbi:MAG: hypothetical protein EHM58_19835 [Ignavibacteriae bacterium]|nr:MAG: hypothetical protein EHM58_19835 [Ignavibacteriota bacterium]